MKLFNSLSNKLETFVPLRTGEVSIYVCGPTVYNDAHIGNMRPVVVFDVLRRLFEYIGYKVVFVSNYTDVDDKIINRAIKEKTSEKEIANHFISEFKKVVEGINSLDPTIAPKVTEHIPEIIRYIENLVDKGAAYVIDGDVYFRINSISNYGELSNVNIDDLISGSRIGENSKKESPLDFVLWKKTDTGINWNSRWSKGRPGWHTECCVMINSLFPDGRIDIHGGGFDLKFPHHENEIAQSKAHNHNAIATYWMHNGFINFGEDKMSKSLGNVILAKDAIKKYGGSVIRLLLLATYYRAPLSLTNEVIETAQSEYSKIVNTIRQLSVSLQLADVSLETKKKPNIELFLGHLCDDLNTPNALTELFAIIKKANSALRQKEIDYSILKAFYLQLTNMLNILGIKVEYPLLNENDKKLYADYLKSKGDKNFAESDRLRQILIGKRIL
ncbi:MAG: cysteine--tRNA ligase [Bacilli bacterium]|nr:cysteine--tRNA ligase [Bacilli bacterium]MDD4005861.1 cysteine--tRNA ligase [Bacilli bacterium]